MNALASSRQDAFILFSFDTGLQEGEGQSPDRTWREDQRRAFTPAVILFIALPSTEDKSRTGVAEISLAQLPRRCPSAARTSIIGHGRRRKQAHDERHDWIWVRRGRCPLCKKTFTILPTWSPPSWPLQLLLSAAGMGIKL